MMVSFIHSPELFFNILMIAHVIFTDSKYTEAGLQQDVCAAKIIELASLTRRGEREGEKGRETKQQAFVEGEGKI